MTISPQAFIHRHALIDEGARIGARTRVWAFAHVLGGAVVGEDCNLCDHTFIEGGVVVGNRVTVKCGVQLWDGLAIEDDVFIGPNVTFTNDPFPRSRRRPNRYTPIRVCVGASIGANATILPGITIGRNSMVGAGAVVTGNVPPNAIVKGNPARVAGYVDADDPAGVARTPAEGRGLPASVVRGVILKQLPFIKDMRGDLTVGEFEKEIPFPCRRYFVILSVPSEKVRGEHAHRACHQFLICLRGSCAVLADDGERRQEFNLDAPNKGLYLPPMTWGIQYKYTNDACLLVFASHIYDPDDYIRSYDVFLAEAGKSQSTSR